MRELELNRPKIYLVLITICIAFASWWFLYSQPLKKNGFGIYLLENNSLIISDENIISYNKTSHEIRLTQEQIGKIEETQASLYGRFVVRINENEIYRGIFVPPYISRSFPSSEIVIIPIVQNENLKIQMGYPAEEFSDEDPRNNVKIFEYFEKTKRLIE
jgi:hypothetical protein